MLLPEDRFQTNEQECAAKVIDGEAVIINLLNGTYYSLDKAGAVMWELLAAGQSVNDVAAAITLRYAVSDADVRTDLNALVQQLIAEKMLVAANGTAPSDTPDLPAFTERAAYAKPELTTYRDMADLLTLDPPMPRLEDIVWTDPSTPPSAPNA